jgi:hypothetical protein
MPPGKKAAGGPTPVEDLRHDETRANIPTGELAGFVADGQAVPPVRYARDPSLDPQLVWRGKDEQDSADLEAHRAAVTASSGAYADAFPAGHLAELRQDWPAGSRWMHVF